MAKKKGNDLVDLSTSIVGSGLSLSLGSTVVGRLPSSAATTGIQSGLSTASGFLPSFAALGGAGIAIKQVRKLDKISLNKRKS
jgi:hypothetical protein